MLIDSAEVVRRLAADPGQVVTAGWVQVRLPGLEPAESERFRREVQRYSTACGCDTGAQAVLLGLAGFAAAWTLAGFPGGVGAAAAGALATLLVAGAAGKAWGLLRSRRRFRRAVRRVLVRLDAVAPAAPDTGPPAGRSDPPEAIRS